MLSARDYTEIVICKRLNKKKDDDLEVSNDDYNKARQRLDRLISFMANDNKIIGFDPEDLEGFFDMKLHQCLRRNVQYKNEFSYFAKTFESLVRDINRMLLRCEQRTYRDPIDDCMFWGETNKMF